MKDKVIKGCFLFNGIEDAFSEELAAEFSEKSFSDRECIYRTDRFERALGIILSGGAEAKSAGGGFLRHFSVGDVFGAAALFGGTESYVSEITARGRTSAAFISENALIAAADCCPRIYRNYIAFLSDRMRYLNRRIAAYTSGDARSRLLYYLSSLRPEENGFAVIPVSMAALAKMLGIGRASLYRAFDSLSADRVIVREKDSVRFTN